MGLWHWRLKLKNPIHRFTVDDALFLMALAIPAIAAAARYVDSEREMTALARSQETPTIAVVRAVMPEQSHTLRVVNHS